MAVPKLLKVTEACQCLNIGKTALYDMIKRKELPVIHIGGCTRIKESEILKLIGE